MKRLTMEYEDKRVSLLPCPFCGSDPLIHSYRRHGVRYSVRCGNEFGHCRMNLRTLDYLELEQAVADWNMRPQEPNEPLTLDELREMDGKPIWVVPLVPDHEDDDMEPEWSVFHAFHPESNFDGYGDRWLAYRRRPGKESEYDNI